MVEPRIQFEPVVARVLEHFALPLSSIHGPVHWARVLENGMRLAPLTGADPLVVSLFSIFHDSCRLNDHADIFHGPRAAVLIRSMNLGLTDTQRDLLMRACAGHTNTFHSSNGTVATCWDADRLDIGRVGPVVNPIFLSTEAAKDPGIRAWAQDRAERGEVPDFAMNFL